MQNQLLWSIAQESFLDDFCITGLGVGHAMPTRMVDRPAGTGDYLFMLFKSPAHIRIGGDLREVAAGSLMIWGPDDSQYYGDTDKICRHEGKKSNCGSGRT